MEINYFDKSEALLGGLHCFHKYLCSRMKRHSLVLEDLKQPRDKQKVVVAAVKLLLQVCRSLSPYVQDFEREAA